MIFDPLSIYFQIGLERNFSLAIEENVTTYSIVDLLARIHFEFLRGSKNIMLESKIIELSVMSVGWRTYVSAMLGSFSNFVEGFP